MNVLKTPILLFFLFSTNTFALTSLAQWSSNHHPIQPVKEGVVTERNPASIVPPAHDEFDPSSEEEQMLDRRIYYLDPQSGATCLGVEGENQCLEP